MPPGIGHMQLQALNDGLLPPLPDISAACLPTAFAPLLGQTRVLAVPPGFTVRCERPGSLEMPAGLAARPGGMVLLRYGLELAWLAAVPGLTRQAAGILAGHAAGVFAAMHADLADPQSPAGGVFARLSGSLPTAEHLQAAAAWLAPTHGGADHLTGAEIAVIRSAWAVAAPAEALLAAGGDERLALNPRTGMNKYGCVPWPAPGVVSFASCTASNLSAGAFAAVEASRQALLAAAVAHGIQAAVAQATQDVAASVLRHFQVEDMADAVITASGTDAALVVTALLAAEQPDAALTSILMSPSETGSGVPHAVQGRHFASMAADGSKVMRGQPVAGMTKLPRLVTIALRDANGVPRPQAAIEAECDAAIRAGLAHGRVVLHAIDGSKTGLTAPDRAACLRLATTYGAALDIVIDACQARIEPGLARWYLDQGFPVLVTGSKFFAAPGFCGAILFPRARLARCVGSRLPAGLSPYAHLAGGLPSRRCPGLILRWRAALHQMAIPAPETAERLDTLGDSVRALLMHDKRLRLVPAPRPPGFGWSDRRSVFTFALHGWSGWMSAAQLRPLYQALSDDDAAGPIASRNCQLGQPVELASCGIGGLRIAFSAAQVVQPEEEPARLRLVLEKLLLLLDRPAEAHGTADRSAARAAG